LKTDLDEKNKKIAEIICEAEQLAKIPELNEASSTKQSPLESIFSKIENIYEKEI